MCNNVEEKYVYFVTFRIITKKQTIATLDPNGKDKGQQVVSAVDIVDYPKQVDSMADVAGIAETFKTKVETETNIEVEHIEVINMNRL